MTVSIKKAVIYCRVSTKEQAEEGNSLVTQEKNCRDYADRFGYEVVATYIEQGESAKTTDRTELKKMLAFCATRKNGINAILSYKIDRISRNTDDYSQIRMQLKRFEVEIKSTSENFEDTPAGRFMENIIANVAQFDNEVRTERSVGGMKAATLEGRYVWNAPYGYVNSKIDGKSNIVPNEYASLVKELFKRAAGTTESLEYIRKDINSKGLKMSKSSFYKTLKLELYCGIITKMGIVARGAYEPLISRELFEKVQSRFKAKRPHSIYKIIHDDFPLRRCIKNEQEEYATGAWSKGRHQHYGYYYFRKSRQNVRKEELEKSFIQFLNRFTVPAIFMIWIDQELRLFFSDRKEKQKKMQQNVREKVADLKEKQRKIITKNMEGIFSDEITKEQLEMITEEINGLQNSIEERETQDVLSNEQKELITNFLNAPGKYWQQLSAKGKIIFQRFNFPEGVIYKNKICRTTKTSMFFNTISQYSNYFSLRVHPNGKQIEPIRSEYYTHLLKTKDVSQLLKLETEIKKLAEILSEAESAM